MKLKVSFEWVIIFLAAFCLLGLFTYQLGNYALASYDEAWYGAITRDLVAHKNPFQLTFNNQPFTDHPPAGYMFMAIATSILGSSEFSVRLTSVVLGVGSIVLIYLLGKALHSRFVGVAAAAILTSCLWFVFRLRSGNLDVPFLFWEILTVYFLVGRKIPAVYLFAVSFAMLILTKTLVGFGLIPLFITVLFLKRQSFPQNSLWKAIVLWLAMVLPWYVINQYFDSGFLRHHFFEIGARGNENAYNFQAIQQALDYLAFGIGKWYKLLLVAIPLSMFCCFQQRKSNYFNFVVLFIWGLGFSPFLISNKTEIWHLLPLYPVVALLIPLSLFTTLHLVLPKLVLLKQVLLLGFLFLAGYQFYQFANLVYFKEPVYSAEKDISVKAKGYEKLYLMETFYPASVYYSQKHIEPLQWDKNAYEKMLDLIAQKDGSVFIINGNTKQQLESNNVKFSVLDQNNSYYLISHQK